jgi:hypothetical protein
VKVGSNHAVDALLDPTHPLLSVNVSNRELRLSRRM